MTSSGTYNFGVTTEVIDFITEAYERIGVDASQLTSQRLDSARRSLEFMFASWANNGPNLWTVDLETLPLTSGTQSYTLDAETLYILHAQTRTTSNGVNTDLTIGPIGRSDYFSLVNKAQEGSRPTQFYFERTSIPTLYVWPVPDNDDVTLRYYRMRAIQDVGLMTNTLDGPNRWASAVVSGLAAALAEKYAVDRLPALAQRALEEYNKAFTEDEERVDFAMIPDYTGYYS